MNDKVRRKSKYRKSPPRDDFESDKEAGAKAGINPEDVGNLRTIELATDQSIAARNLLYHPNKLCLDVIDKCAKGIVSIMERLKSTGDDTADLQKDEILISMCTRLMADGGTGRIEGFNERLAQLVVMQKQTPRPESYDKSVKRLANDCRQKMSNITAKATMLDSAGALARQALLSFMGDCGGFEGSVLDKAGHVLKKADTGFGGYKGPLCDPDLVYKLHMEGVCYAQGKLNGREAPFSKAELISFEKKFNRARLETSMKGGGLSAPAHTKSKKGERIVTSFDAKERRGLLNTGDMAEQKLREANPDHKKTLLDASWPSFVVSTQVTQDVVEPVTGHVSGTFGEMVVTMNMFCGTPPDHMTWQNPSGESPRTANNEQVTAIAALAAAGLISAGFHSAVEVFQPMSTFTTHATHGSLGPKAVELMNRQANAIRIYADNLDTFKDGRPEKWEYDQYELSEEELRLDKESLLSKAESLEDAATKSVDMISVLQGAGGTLATLEVSRVMANYSSQPQVVFNLFSLNTRLDELGLRGHTSALEKARELASLPVSIEQQAELTIALKAAKQAADHLDLLHKNETQAEIIAEATEVVVEVAETMLKLKQENLELAIKATAKALKTGWGRDYSQEEILRAKNNLESLEEERKQFFREVGAQKLEVKAAKLEATAARKKVMAIKRELTAIKLEAGAAGKDIKAASAEATADVAENKAKKAENIAAEKQQLLELATKATETAAKAGWGGTTSPEEALKARQNMDALEGTRKQAFREAASAQKEAIGAREAAANAKEVAINLRERATRAKEEAAQTAVAATSTKKELTDTSAHSKTMKKTVQQMKISERDGSPKLGSPRK